MKKTTYIALIFLLCCSIFSLSAQRKRQYLPYEDLRPYHFGFSVGLHTQDFQIQHSGAMDAQGNRWYGIVPDYTPGFSVGVLGDYRIADALSLRLTPCIHFGSKNLSLFSDAPDNEPESITVRSNYIMLPLMLRYRGARTNNYRPYLATGFSIGLDAGKRKNEAIELKDLNTYWELAFGCDLYMPYFRLVPEIKICIGLDDIFQHNRLDEASQAYVNYTKAFDKITSRLLVLSFQFE